MTRKFKLPAEPGTTPKNIRFPNYVIDQVEEAIRGTLSLRPQRWPWKISGRRKRDRNSLPPPRP